MERCAVPRRQFPAVAREPCRWLLGFPARASRMAAAAVTRRADVPGRAAVRKSGAPGLSRSPARRGCRAPSARRALGSSPRPRGQNKARGAGDATGR